MFKTLTTWNNEVFVSGFICKQHIYLFQKSWCWAAHAAAWQWLNHFVDDGANLLYVAFHHIPFLKGKVQHQVKMYIS